ncbi:MAG TPA: hypothetical protein DCP92_13595 [Nitrospiraceae bacterium]|nr:hypothetical protein [Nitrospiraceae bacterium]
MIFSAISAYFYLRIVIYMYMRDPRAELNLSTSKATRLTLAVTGLAVLFIGILPSNVIDLARSTVMGF